MNNTTTNNVEATYRTSLFVWNEFTIYDALLQTTQSYLDEIHECGNLYSPCFEELGELLETECRSLWGGLNPDGDRLADVDWNEIAEEWYESCLECFEDSLNWEETR
jgi:hypothetical protein